MAFAPAAGRVFAATAAKSAGGSKEEKGLLDWILGGLLKEDQLLETDPILQKVDEKNGGSGTGSTTRGRKNSVAVPQKKKGGFGGLFAKNEWLIIFKFLINWNCGHGVSCLSLVLVFKSFEKNQKLLLLITRTLKLCNSCSFLYNIFKGILVHFSYYELA